MRTSGNLLGFKDFFETKESAYDRLRTIIKDSENVKKIYDVQTAEFNFKKGRINQEQFDETVSEIRSWKGFNYDDLTNCVIIVKLSCDEKSRQKWFLVKSY